MDTRNGFLSLFLAAVLGASIAACAEESPEQGAPAGGTETGAVPVVYVVNYPLKYFAERIGGEHVEVVFPRMEGDPAYREIDPDTVRAYQEADLILLNGAGYASWIDKVMLPESKLFDTSEGFKDRYIQVEDAVTHSHGPEGEHVHAATAITTWLDLSLAVEQARAIREAFVRLKPDKEEAFQAGFEALAADLNDLDQRIQKVVAGGTDRPLVVSHPVYQYFTRRYGLNVKSVHWEPDEMPTSDLWSDFGKLLTGHPAKWMIWEGVPMEESVNRLKALGVESTVFSPCGNVPDQGDFLSVMKENVKNLEAVFGG